MQIPGITFGLPIRLERPKATRNFLTYSFIGEGYEGRIKIPIACLRPNERSNTFEGNVKGGVFCEPFEFVESQFGYELVDRLIDLRKLKKDGTYTRVGT